MAFETQGRLNLPSIQSWAGSSAAQHHLGPQLQAASSRTSSASPAPHTASAQVCQRCGRPLEAASGISEAIGRTCSICKNAALEQPSPAAGVPPSPAIGKPIEAHAPLSQPHAAITSNPAQVQPSNRAKDEEPPAGSCPGDGVCNGAGGKTCCNGCPAYNNKIYTAHRHAEGSNGRARKVKQEGATDGPDEDPASSLQPTAGPSDQKPDPESFGGMACENCGTRTTPLWRRDGQGKVACNACGLYYKLHGHHRPVGMKRTTIKRRKRAPASSKDDGGQGPDNDSGEASPAPPAKKPRKKRKPAASEAQEVVGAATSSENGLDALLTAGAQSLERSSASPSTQNMSLPDLALVASRMARQEEKESQAQQQPKVQQHASPGDGASPPSGSAMSLAPAPSPLQGTAPLPGKQQHHHHPHLHRHHHPHLHPAHPPRLLSAACLPNASALPTNTEELMAYRKNLQAQVKATQDHMIALQGFVQKGEQVLAQIDETLSKKSAAPDTNHQPAAPEATAEPASRSSEHPTSPRTNDLQPSAPVPTSVGHSHSPPASATTQGLAAPPPAQPALQQSVAAPSTNQDDFYARLASLPVQAAVPLRKRYTVPQPAPLK